MADQEPKNKSDKPLPPNSPSDSAPKFAKLTKEQVDRLWGETQRNLKLAKDLGLDQQAPNAEKLSPPTDHKQERIYIPHQVLPGETKEQAARRMAEEMVARLKDQYEPRYPDLSKPANAKKFLGHLKEIQNYQERNGLPEKGPALGG